MQSCWMVAIILVVWPIIRVVRRQISQETMACVE